MFLGPLYEFAKNDPVGHGLNGNSAIGRAYQQLVATITATVAESRGVYTWGKFDVAGTWHHIYIGQSGIGARPNLRKRLRDELRKERSLIWRHTMSVGQLRTKSLEYYPAPGGTGRYDYGWTRVLAKSGSTHIIWVSTEHDGAILENVEAALIEILKPAANIRRRRPLSVAGRVLSDIVGQFNARINSCGTPAFVMFDPFET
ncbi:MAG TPA: hypothetical protein VII06_10250 [Chloroflexota bacterium]